MMKFVMFCGDGDVIVEFDNLRNCGVKESALRRKVSIAMFRKAINAINKGRIRQNTDYLKRILTETST